MALKVDPDALGFLIAETARMMNVAFERKIANAGLDITPAEARTLCYVAASEGARQNNIAERMGVEPMTVCAYLDRLEKLQLVMRAPDPKDRRAKNIHTTDAADAILRGIKEQMDQLFGSLLTQVEPEKLDAMKEVMVILRENLRVSLAEKPIIQAEMA
jgi:MarR family transcriptional regulator for hemolysin